MATRNPTEEWRRTCIISLFCLMEDELNGYNLKQRLKKWRIHKHLPVSPATIYRALGKLEEQGCLLSRSVKNGNYPPSTVFQITEAGKQRYQELLEEESNFTRTEFSEHVFIGMCSYLPREERKRMARKRKQDALRHLKKLQQKLDNYEQEEGKPYAEWLLLDHEIHMVQAQITWLDHFIDLLSKNKA